eukprot:2393482-Prymnesium_polylepis.1
MTLRCPNPPSHGGGRGRDRLLEPAHPARCLDYLDLVCMIAFFALRPRPRVVHANWYLCYHWRSGEDGTRICQSLGHACGRRTAR